MKEVTGCILVGGKSTRMGGGIKSLKNFNNKTILERIIERSINQVSKLIINSNIINNSLQKYKLPIISDAIQGYLGPLAGIHASLNWTRINNPKHKWVITLAGDSPFFPKNIVNLLYEKAVKEDSKIVLAKSYNRNHPIFGIWHTSLEKDLEISILNKKIRKIEQWATKHNFNTINFNDKEYDPFFNINTQEDLIKAEEIENYYFDK